MKNLKKSRTFTNCLLMTAATGLTIAMLTGTAVAETVDVDLTDSVLKLYKNIYGKDIVRLKIRDMEGLAEAVEDADGFTLILGADPEDPAVTYDSGYAPLAPRWGSMVFYLNQGISMQCSTSKEKCTITLLNQDIIKDLLDAEMEFSLEIGDTSYTNYGEWSLTDGRFAPYIKWRYEKALPKERIVFLSKGAPNGTNLGGLSGADAFCQSEASLYGLSGTYKAWISDSVESPDTRFEKKGGPFVLVNGVVIADDWQDLTDGTLQHPIDIGADETDHPVFEAYTNTAIDGTAYSTDPNLTCLDWTDVNSTYHFWSGEETAANERWTHDNYYTCGSRNYWGLYCFQQ